MKKITLFVLLFVLATNAFCQSGGTPEIVIQNEHVAKSKKQKGMAWILLASGTALLTITAMSETNSYCFSNCQKPKTPAAPVITSGALIVGSIPLFISSSKNKRKGMSFSTSLNLEKTSSFIQPVVNSVPSVSVTFSW